MITTSGTRDAATLLRSCASTPNMGAGPTAADLWLLAAALHVEGPHATHGRRASEIFPTAGGSKNG